MAMGRPQKPYHTSWGELIQGLYRCPDGRWRINRTGSKFTEPDERLAVKRFRDQSPIAEIIQLPVYDPASAKNNADVNLILASRAEMIIDPADPDAPATIVRNVHATALWRWFREQLLARPEYVAQTTGIPELAGLAHMALPRPSLKLTAIIDAYQKHNPSTAKAKQEALAPLRKLIAHANAKTLDDLTTERLLAFRQAIESSETLKSAGTRRGYFGRIKSIISFAAKVGLDADQVSAFLARAKVLWTAEPMPAPKPAPISREQFHALLAAGNGSWRPWLLLGLNLCLHLEEVCALRWEDFNLTAGTYAAIRNKTRRMRIPRAATLWPETLGALKVLKRTGSPHVFNSTHGTRFNRNTRGNEFAGLRKLAELPDDVTFDSIRDGSYTAAAQANGVDEKCARVLAGHASPGLQDNYVLRNPEMVRPACDAVYRAYGPFPAKRKAKSR